MPDTGFTVCPHCGWNTESQPSNPLYLPPGTSLQAPYQVARVLGHGGFGITYLGWDANLQIKVAIKEYLPRDFATRDPQSGEVISYGGDAEFHFTSGLQQFLDEARMLAKFQQHAGIVSVLTFFRAFGTGYMVMEYVEGETLRTYLQRGRVRLNWDQTLGIFMHIMDALRAVHSVGLLHRDIAPDNIYLCSDGRVKLLDFGAARQNLASDGHTMAIVKPGFAPEEQYRDSGVQGAWSDVYSVAASMYFCLTGNVPPDAMSRLSQDALKPPSEYGAALPPAIEACLMAGLAVRASQRPHTIAEFQKNLLDQAEPVEVKVSNSPQSKPSKFAEPPETSRQPVLERIQIIEREPPVASRLSWMLAGAVLILILIVVYNQVRRVDPYKRAGSQPSMVNVDKARDVSTSGVENQDGRAKASQWEQPAISAEELKSHQEAALQRFEDRRRQDTAASLRAEEVEKQRGKQLRSLCAEWGATMDCNDVEARQ